VTFPDKAVRVTPLGETHRRNQRLKPVGEIASVCVSVMLIWTVLDVTLFTVAVVTVTDGVATGVFVAVDPKPL
jgi:hypothetical protein